MYFYSISLPDGPYLLDFDDSWRNIWLNFVCENKINHKEMHLQEGDKLGSFIPDNRPTGVIHNIAIGCTQKELIVVPEALYLSCDINYHPDWLKKRLINPSYQYEIWLAFIAPLTGFLRVCWNHKGIADTREVPCVHLLRKHS